MSDTANEKRLIRGRVISDKMDKSIVVELVRKVAHPLYGKYVKKTSKFHVHDPKNTANQGDVVTFKASRPHSKLKHWELVAVVEQAAKQA